MTSSKADLEDQVYRHHAEVCSTIANPKRLKIINTLREKEILQTLSGGASNKEIANTLHISEHTVKIHLKNILKKLHMNNRIQAAVYAHQQGLVADAPKTAPSGRPGASGSRR